jgi:CheY-like chemotaxis protein
MDGQELAWAITRNPKLATTKVILLIPYGQSQHARDAAKLDAAWLQKPVRLAPLLDLLTSVRGDSGAVPDSVPWHRAGRLSPAALASRPAAAERDGAVGAVTASTTIAADTRGHAPPAADAMRVLVVDDSEINRRVACGMLEKLGYRPEEVASGQEALDALARSAYAAVLMDCQMPGMDGFQATAAIREREADATHTPVIAMTARAMRGDRERCIAAGMDDYVPKPFRAHELDAVLRRHVRGTASPAFTFVGGTGDAATGGRAWAGHPADSAPSAPAGRPKGRGRRPPEPPPELVALFVREVPRHLTALEEAIAREDARALEQTAHRLKSEAGMVGADKMMALCEELEALGYTGTTVTAAELLKALRRAFSQAKARWTRRERARAASAARGKTA